RLSIASRIARCSCWYSGWLAPGSRDLRISFRAGMALDITNHIPICKHLTKWYGIGLHWYYSGTVNDLNPWGARKMKIRQKPLASAVTLALVGLSLHAHAQQQRPQTTET